MKSPMIHTGETIMIPATKIPKGFRNNDFTISPLNKKETALVVPQDGHGKLVALLKIHTVKSKPEFFMGANFKKSNQL